MCDMCVVSDICSREMTVIRFGVICQIHVHRRVKTATIEGLAVCDLKVPTVVSCRAGVSNDGKTIRAYSKRDGLHICRSWHQLGLHITN